MNTTAMTTATATPATKARAEYRKALRVVNASDVQAVQAVQAAQAAPRTTDTEWWQIDAYIIPGISDDLMPRAYAVSLVRGKLADAYKQKSFSMLRDALDALDGMAAQPEYRVSVPHHFNESRNCQLWRNCRQYIVAAQNVRDGVLARRAIKYALWLAYTAC